MKKIFIVFGLFAVAGCSKNWKCEIIQTTEGTGTTYDGVKVTEYEFKGTKEEKDNYESMNSNVLNLFPGTITTEVDCK